jgi:hypothetical protein
MSQSHFATLPHPDRISFFTFFSILWVRPPGGPSPASAAGLCLSGIRQTIEELMNGCNLAYASLGQGEPFRMFFQYADAPAFARRQVRQLLTRSALAGKDAPADGEPSSAASMGTTHSCNTGAEDEAHIVEPATVVH